MVHNRPTGHNANGKNSKGHQILGEEEIQKFIWSDLTYCDPLLHLYKISGRSVQLWSSGLFMHNLPIGHDAKWFKRVPFFTEEIQNQ